MAYVLNENTMIGKRTTQPPKKKKKKTKQRMIVKLKALSCVQPKS